MSTHRLPWERDHLFGQDVVRSGERKTFWVVILTTVTMIAEILAGLIFGSMALLADGVHMASHALALGVVTFAYFFSRRHAADRRYSFGTGKINTLSGFTGALLFGVFALGIAWESVSRLFSPVPIQWGPAFAVAFLGLGVNVLSAFILDAKGEEHDDHGLKAAYFHVLADALTSLLAIVAIAAAWFWGIVWLDPIIGIFGAALIAYWAIGLLSDTAKVLLDWQASEEMMQSIRQAVEDDQQTRVTDLHVWGIGPGIHACEVVVLSKDPQPPEHYGNKIPKDLGVVHTVVEVHQDGKNDNQ